MLLDSDLILGIFSENKELAERKFIEYNEIESQDEFLEDTLRTRLTDEEARNKIIKLINGYSIPEIKGLQKEQRNEMLSKIMKLEGLSQRQAARILGISPNLLFKL
jgi:putative transposase